MEKTFGTDVIWYVYIMWPENCESNNQQWKWVLAKEEILRFNKSEFLVQSLSCIWVKSNTSCNNISTSESKFNVLLQKVFLSFGLHFYWLGIVVYFDSNVTGDFKL